MSKSATPVSLAPATGSSPQYDYPALARAAILATGMLLLCRDVTNPYTARHEWNSAVFSLFARNHIQYGLGKTHLFCTWGDTASMPAEPQRYLNHPPLVAIWAAVPMLLFGDHEWAVRMVPIAATLGSAWLVMTLASRIGSPALGFLTGFVYLVLPVTAFFGRMVCHEAPVEFFMLLMLHGYMRWAGHYPNEPPSRAGAAWYVIGTVLGLATGWATALMAALIFLWQLVVSIRLRSGWRTLIWTFVVPASTLAVVVTHILWGSGWDTGLFKALLLSRAQGDYADEVVTWATWGVRLWRNSLLNFSLVGVIALSLYPIAAGLILRCSDSRSPWRGLLRRGTCLIPVAILFLQAIVWQVALRRQSYIHEYWQFFLAPSVALAIASLILTAWKVVVCYSKRLATAVVMLLLLLPMPLFARSIDTYHRWLQVDPADVQALIELNRMLPAYQPVMTSIRYSEWTERVSSRTIHWVAPQIAYYARRPLIRTTDFTEIQANPAHCTAYLFRMTGQPANTDLAQHLASRYRFTQLTPGFAVFHLNSPKR